MELNSTGGTTPKSTRSKAKTPADTAAPKPKTTRSRKAKTAEQPAIEVTAITPVSVPSGRELAGMIATAAYYLAERRNFAPGYELEDWLAAERQIRTLHT